MKTKLQLLILLLALFQAAVAQTGAKCREEKQISGLSFKQANNQ